MPTTRTRFQFTVDEYERMIETGILTEHDRVELIRGEIIDKMPIGDQHAASVNRAARLFNRRPDGQFNVSIQNPVLLADSAPEPDILLLRWRPDFYASGKPRAGDALLILEISDSTLDYDQDVKLSIHAEAGILEYWILNLVDEWLEVHRDPQADGTYADVQVVRRGQSIAPLFDPALLVAVDDLF